ncbi:MAG: hypothetical protein AUG44_08760 [Actinobacteria bacterium 13_1_20CM_3_71_11]|nr:MAG: hypothetical protein AUG44_08760 [Actinobacteria bacterium 13_1_20CM_3_71_11]
MTAEVTQWIAPDGSSTTLDVDWDATGRYMPDVNHEQDEIPGQPGARHRASRHKAHEFTIKLWLSTVDEASLRTSIRQLVYAMDPTRGEGIVRVTSPIGDVREIACYYTAGLGLEEKPDSSGPTAQAAAVTFRAFDPYWRDTSDTSNTWAVSTTPTFFPIFPLRLTSSQIAVDGSVANNGDVATWPVWTITGPGGVIVLRNITTGENIIFSTTTLGIGESISIDTRPGIKTVTKSDGTNLWPDLDLTSSLWSLAAGNNAIRLEMSGVDATRSSLQLNYRQRYLSP